MSLFALFTLAKPQISGKGYKKSTFGGQNVPGGDDCATFHRQVAVKL